MPGLSIRLTPTPYHLPRSPPKICSAPVTHLHSSTPPTPQHLAREPTPPSNSPTPQLINRPDPPHEKPHADGPGTDIQTCMYVLRMPPRALLRGCVGGRLSGAAEVEDSPMDVCIMCLCSSVQISHAEEGSQSMGCYRCVIRRRSGCVEVQGRKAHY